MNYNVTEKIVFTVYIIIFLLMLSWCSNGYTATTIDESCFRVQQECDEVLHESDGIILMQAKAYAEVNKQNKQLELDIFHLQSTNYELSHPTWNNDPMWAGLLGVLAGIVLGLKSAK